MNEAGTPLVLLAAGGTGGHLFPAEALAAALTRRGVIVDLATDARGGRYRGTFPARQVHVIPSETVRSRNPIALARTGAILIGGLVRAHELIRRIQPAAVVGFGGYPTVPPVLAATLWGIPTVIHEQNAVMGRANRFLASPLRPQVIAAAASAYLAPEPGGLFRLLVFGGSQGAKVMADIMPPAITKLDVALRTRLLLAQQAREEDLGRVRESYARLKISSEVAPFFPDLPARIAAAHLVISRSGAGTVAELAAIGRPAILVPLPHALDQDQMANAAVLETAGGAIRLRQEEFTPERLAAEIMQLASAPKKLVAMALAARLQGTLDAAERLADLVLHLAGFPRVGV